MDIVQNAQRNVYGQSIAISTMSWFIKGRK